MARPWYNVLCCSRAVPAVAGTHTISQRPPLSQREEDKSLCSLRFDHQCWPDPASLASSSSAPLTQSPRRRCAKDSCNASSGHSGCAEEGLLRSWAATSSGNTARCRKATFPPKVFFGGKSHFLGTHWPQASFPQAPQPLQRHAVGCDPHNTFSAHRNTHCVRGLTGHMLYASWLVVNWCISIDHALVMLPLVAFHIAQRELEQNI